MIHEIGVELKAALAANDCPIVVVDGPEHGESVVTPRERIVIERDFGAPEPVVGPKGAGRNPQHAYDRQLAAKVTIYAQSPKSGALYFEHLRRLDDIVDEVLIGLRKVLTVRKNGGFGIGAGKLVELADAKGTRVTNFAVYEVPFMVPRAVEVRTWTGDALAEVAIGGAGGVVITSVTRVTQQGDPTPTLETACGA